jgi:adenosylhomocysteine nucleosidase
VATDVNSESGKVVVLFALEREAAPFRRAAGGLPYLDISVSGIGHSRARAIAEQITASSPRMVIAAGFCGALQTGLAVGDVFQAAEVVDLSGRVWTCSPISGEKTGRLLTSNKLITTRGDKIELGLRHGASVVDMESAAIADVCAERGIPFASIRAVSDSVEDELSLELVLLLSGGTVSVWRACRALLRKPTLLGEFRRLARDTRLAARNLAEVLTKLVQAKA